MKITIVDYDPEWAALYEREAESIAEILGGLLVEIHHIGSTSVDGLKAKPVIDIMPVVTDITSVDALDPQFERLGYECMGEFGIAGRRYFRKGGYNRTHHVHIFEQSNRKDIERHIAVRDYLRTHRDVADEYVREKIRAAEQCSTDGLAYNNAKDKFVKQMERDALVWYKHVNVYKGVLNDETA